MLFLKNCESISGTTIHDDNIGDEVSAFEMQEAEETNSKYKDLKQVLDVREYTFILVLYFDVIHSFQVISNIIIYQRLPDQPDPCYLC